MKRSLNIRKLGALAALLLFFGASHAQDQSKPLLLVAAPELEGGYHHTAVLVAPVGDGHLGFILNRATRTQMGALFPNHPPSAKVVDPLYFGGPEEANAIFAIVRRDPGAPSLRLFDDCFVTASAASVDRIIEETPNDARFFVGFVGWRPGELEQEIEKGFWYVGAPEASLVFRKDTSEMWDELVLRLGQRLSASLQR
jgi:putative transcriptional regulator